MIRTALLPPISHRIFYSLIMLWILCLPLTSKAADSDEYVRRFNEAQSLAKQGKDAAASKIYQALIKQDPGQPQAYNNLAAIKARHGELKEAQALLEQALRSNPIYATVYENLSAIYVEMARDSYGKALHLETPQQPIALRELTEPTPVKATTIQTAAVATEKTRTPTASSLASTDTVPDTTPPVTTSEPPPTRNDKMAQPATTTVNKPEVAKEEEATPDLPAPPASAETSAEATPNETVPAVPEKPPVTEQASVEPTETPQAPPANTETSEVTPNVAPLLAGPEKAPISEPASTPTEAAVEKPESAGPVVAASPPVGISKDELLTTLQGWAAAWSGKAVNLYLSFYTDNYAPEGMTHEQWQAQRRSRLQAPKWIQVTLSDFQVDAIKGDEARVRLIQQYKADNYQDKTRKELRLRHTPDGWRIVEEKTMAKLR